MKRAVLLMSLAFLAGLATPSVALGGGCHGAADGKVDVARTKGAAAATHVAKCGFYPTVLYVDRGAEITWTNKDPVPHTVTGVALSWGSEEAITRGEQISASFPKDGVFPYYCVLHPGMVGAVVVGDPDPDEISLSAPLTLDQENAAATGSGGGEKSDSSNEPLLLGGIAAVGAVVIGGVWLFLRRRHAPF